MRTPTKRGFLLSVALVLSVLTAATATGQDQPASNMEILKDKIRADKKLVVAQNLALTESEAKAFWPIYEAYQKDLEELNQKLARTIQSYADEYNANTLTDARASSLMSEALASEEAEVALKKQYLERLRGVIPAMKAVRYLQIESKVRALVRMDLAANIPLVQ